MQSSFFSLVLKKYFKIISIFSDDLDEVKNHVTFLETAETNISVFFVEKIMDSKFFQDLLTHDFKRAPKTSASICDKIESVESVTVSDIMPEGAIRLEVVEMSDEAEAANALNALTEAR